MRDLIRRWLRAAFVSLAEIGVVIACILAVCMAMILVGMVVIWAIESILNFNLGFILLLVVLVIVAICRTRDNFRRGT